MDVPPKIVPPEPPMTLPPQLDEPVVDVVEPPQLEPVIVPPVLPVHDDPPLWNADTASELDGLPKPFKIVVVDTDVGDEGLLMATAAA